MIKGTYFSKFLKPCLFGLLISFIMVLGNSVNAIDTHGGDHYIAVNSTAYDSAYDTSVKNQALAGGNFKSTSLGLSRNIFTLFAGTQQYSGNFFRRTPEGKPYYYNSWVQGYFKQYALCPGFSGTDTVGATVLNNCVYSDITGNYQSIFRTFFEDFGVGDLVYYSAYNQPPNVHQFFVCYNSSTLDSSLCFNYSYDNRTQGCVNCVNELIDSKDIGYMTFMSFDQDIGYAPGQLGYGGGGELVGPSTGNVDNVIVGDYTYSTCTYGDIKTYMDTELGYSPYLCYGGLDNFDLYDPNITYHPIPGSGKTLNEILNNMAYQGGWDTPLEWYNFWRGLYVDRYNNSWNDMWSSYPAVYRTWFDIINQYGGLGIPFQGIMEYCTAFITLDIDLDNEYHGTSANPLSSVCNAVITEKNNGNWNGSGVIQGVNRDGVGGTSGSKTYNDGSVFIQDFFNKLKENLKTNYSGGAGVLPTYIIIFLVAIMLFKFLRK